MEKLRQTGTVFYSLSQLLGLLPNLHNEGGLLLCVHETTSCRTHSISIVQASGYCLIPGCPIFCLSSPQNSQIHIGVVTVIVTPTEPATRSTYCKQNQ